MPEESDKETGTPSTITSRIFWQSMILAAGGFVGLVDSSIIAIAVPNIASDFDASVSVVQWTSAGYLLAMATVIPLTSSLCHRYGAQHTWVMSLAVFTGATLAAGLAWSLSSLIVFRVIQGLGGGMLFPLMRLLAVEIAGQSRMGRVMALTAIPVQIAPIVGPVLGGIIIDQSSWRWALWASIPLALLALIPAPVDSKQTHREHDSGGLLVNSHAHASHDGHTAISNPGVFIRFLGAHLRVRNSRCLPAVCFLQTRKILEEKRRLRTDVTKDHVLQGHHPHCVHQQFWDDGNYIPDTTDH